MALFSFFLLFFFFFSLNVFNRRVGGVVKAVVLFIDVPLPVLTAVEDLHAFVSSLCWV